MDPSDELISRCSALTQLTDAFCTKRLTEEYRVLARRLVERLSSGNPTLLLRGEARISACAAIYALGFVNFLFDPETEPHVTPKELCDAFGVKVSSAYNKSRAIRECLSMIQFDPEWCLPSLLDDNPLVWMLEINGIAIDVRLAAPDVQRIAYEKGLIPHIPKAPHRARADDPSQRSLGLGEEDGASARRRDDSA